MQVPSTPTANDKMKERLALSHEIAALKVQKETLTREVQDLVSTKEDVIKQSGFTPHEYKKVQDGHFEKMKGVEERLRILKDDVAKEEAKFKSLKEADIITGRHLERMKDEEKTLSESVERLSIYLDGLTRDEIRRKAYIKDQIDKDTRELKKLQDDIQALRLEYSAKLNDIHKREDVVLEGERLLSIRQTDMDILEERFRNRYPNETVIL